MTATMPKVWGTQTLIAEFEGFEYRLNIDYEGGIDLSVKGLSDVVNVPGPAFAALARAYLAQAESPKPARQIEATWGVPSQSDPGLQRIVTRYDDGSWTCTCPGFEHRLTCRHIDQIRGKLT